MFDKISVRKVQYASSPAFLQTISVKVYNGYEEISIGKIPFIISSGNFDILLKYTILAMIRLCSTL